MLHAAYDFAAIWCLIRQGLLLFFRFRRQKTFQHNQCRTDTNGSIGKVEGGEVPVADVEVDHIDNEAVPQAVDRLPSAPPIISA